MVEEAGAHEEAVLVALHPEAAPIHEQLGALVHAGLHKALHALQGCGGDERAEVGFLVRVGRYFQRLDLRKKLLYQLVRGGLADRYGNRDRHAAFARRAEARAQKRIGGLIQVCIGHDNHVVLGAAESLNALSVRGAGGVDVVRDGRRADEANGLDIRVRQGPRPRLPYRRSRR